MPPPATPTVTQLLGCSAVEASSTPEPSRLIPAVSQADFVSGPDNAAVTLLLYCDLQSAECELFNRVLDQLVEVHGPDVRVVHRLFPVPADVVPTLDKSQISARAALAAGNQGKFWELRDLLHRRYTEWAELSEGEFRGWLLAKIPELEIDPRRFAVDLDSPETLERAKTAYETAAALGIAAIPTVFLNGRLQERPALSYGGLETTIGLIALAQRQYRSCPPFVIDTDRLYHATIQTEKGDISIELFAERTPLAVNSFVFLASAGWFDNTTFHRVLPGFVAQGGDPSGTGRGGPGYYFQNEVYSDLRFDRPGRVGLANSGLDTNGSQFFITYAPQQQLDGAYTVFGQVVTGMEVVESLTPRDPELQPHLPPGDQVFGVTVEQP